MLINHKKILLAGIGSGSLGLELLKCISLDNSYLVYGADVDPAAYGHSDSRFKRTFLINSTEESNYCSEIINICKLEGIQYIAPGAETTNRILCRNQEIFKNVSIFPLVNSLTVYDICSDKVRCNAYLKLHGLPSPHTVLVPVGSSLYSFPVFPCVVKPSSESGGSNMVFLAEDLKEAQFFVTYLAARGASACVQEYIDSPNEFTVGVLSSPNGKILSSVALQRNLSSKLSRSMSYGTRIISSGWSQGRIEYFPEVCEQAEKIALSLGSTWALNIQGRVRDGLFIPFEINPRHSGTSYFRALSGFNEILIGLENLSTQADISNLLSNKIKPATYYRILTERVLFD